MATIASLLVRLGVDTRTVKADLDRGTKDMEEAGKKAGRHFSAGMKATIAAGALTLAGAGFMALKGQVSDAIGAASDLNETVSKTQQIFGAVSPQIESFAATAARGLGQSKQEAMDAAATFAVFGKGAGLTGNKLAGFSTELVTLASDMASFGNTTPQQAIEALGAALRGESEPIRAYGVLLDDATLRQRAMALGIVKSTKEALTPQQKVLAAHAEILAQTKDAQGDFTKTSKGLANQQRIQRAEMENLRAELGQKLLPVQLKVTKAMGEMAKFVERNQKWLIPLVAIIGTLVGILKIYAAVQWAVNIAMSANPIGLIIIGIIALIAAVVLLVKNWDKVKAAAVAVWGWIWDHLKAFGRWMKDVFVQGFRGNIALMVAAWQWIKDKAVDVWEWIKALPGRIGAAFSALGGMIIAPFQTAFNRIAELWNNTIGRISMTVPSWVPGIGGKSWSMPKLPTLGGGGGTTVRPTPTFGRNLPTLLHSGGIVPGSGDQLITAKGGEGVFTPSQMAAMGRGAGGGRMVLELRSGGSMLDDLLIKLLLAALRRDPQLRKQLAVIITGA